VRDAWLTPSKLVDELWHRHMLDTIADCKFCEWVNGGYLHHTPHYGTARRRAHSSQCAQVWARKSGTLIGRAQPMMTLPRAG
jgi:hypothetical protein